MLKKEFLITPASMMFLVICIVLLLNILNIHLLAVDYSLFKIFPAVGSPGKNRGPEWPSGLKLFSLNSLCVTHSFHVRLLTPF